MSEDSIQQVRREIVETCRRMHEEGLVKGTAGNISVRTGDQVVITPSSVPYDRLTPDQLCVVDLDGNSIEGDRPSSETPFHTILYRETDAAAVVHTHSVYATTIASTAAELPAIHYAVHAFGGDRVEIADYQRFGSDALADAVRDALGDRRGVLLRNHGALVHGPSLEKAYELAQVLEWLSELYWRAQVFGEPSILTGDQIEEVRTEARRRRHMMQAKS